jgi:predicted negative regulator of RcsB-dependent stress response
MKHFIKENGGLIALLVVIATGIWWIQSTIVKGQIEQQKQFTEMIEKIGNVEKQSILRDHKLELELERIKLAKN